MASYDELAAIIAEGARPAGGGVALPGGLSRFGVQTHLDNSDGTWTSADLDALQAELPSVNWVRDNVILRSQVQTISDGAQSSWTYNWTTTEARWGEINSRGLKLFAGLFDGAPAESNFPPSAQYIDYVVQYVSRCETLYPGLIVAIELCNEPDGTWDFGLGRIPVIVPYANLCIQTYLAVRSLSQFDHIPIVVGVTTPYSAPWWTRFVKSGALDFCDAVSWHPYNASEGVHRQFIDLRALLDSAGFTSLPMLATEFAAHSDAWNTAKNLVQHLANDPGGLSSYFILRDTPGFPNGGLLDEVLAIKDQGNAFNNIITKLGSAAFVGKLNTSPGTLIYQFAGNKFFMFGTTAQTVNVTGTHTVEDHLGGALSATGAYVMSNTGPILVIGSEPLMVAEDLGGDMLLTFSRDDFPKTQAQFVQGHNGWHYKMRREDGSPTEENPVFTDDTFKFKWALSSYSFSEISEAFHHPSIAGVSDQVAMLRRYMVPAGVARVRVNITVRMNAGGGETTNLLIHRSGGVPGTPTTRWSRTITSTVNAVFDQIFDVTEGDALDLETLPGASASNDATVIILEIYESTKDVTAVDIA